MGDLYWGDNLRILRNDIDDASVDLIYLDQPFNSNRNYNVLFREKSQQESNAQIEAFTDTWHWGEQAEETYAELAHGNHVPQNVSDLIVAMRSFIGSNDVMAYLVMMTIRLLELHRVLKPTGSIYLHCDPTASHYLKVVMDTIWGPKNFRNEIIWRRTRAHNDRSLTRFGSIHDTILYYAKSGDFTFNKVFLPRSPDAPKTHDLYRHADGNLYRKDNCKAPGGRGPRYEWNGHVANWRFTQEQARQLEAEGKIVYTKSGMPRFLRPIDESRGSPVQDMWTDIDPPNSGSAEILGYPTQKPLALLERIITASSNPGDVVLDPFCGCGTAIAAAEKLNRRWIGIDITHLAIALIVSRMQSAFPGVVINRHGEPADVGGARALAELNRYDFQNWALAFVEARPVAQGADGKSKKGADRGIDGVISFLGENQKTPHRCLVQVKSGHVNSATIRDLKGTVEREKAEMGLLVTLEEPTGPMRTEAIEAGFYHSDLMSRDYPRIQIITIRELFDRREPQLPPRYSPYRLAQHQQREVNQPRLFADGST